MAPIVDGIVSGINTTELINKLLDVAKAPITTMEIQQIRLNSKKAKFQELNTLLGTLQTALKAVDTEAEFSAFSTSSSQSTAVTATITGAATPGSHAINVSAVAQTNLWNSGGFATSTDVLKDGTMQITVGSGTPVNITIDSANITNTIGGLASYINANIAGANAWVINTGSGNTPYKLMVESSDTGTAKALTITVNQTGSTGEDLSMSSIRSATDATLTVDTVSITSSSNSIVDVLPGLTLDLLNTTSGDATLTVSRDTTVMADKVQTVVDAYNALDAFFDSQAGTAETAVLSGDSTLRSVQNGLQTQLSAVYSSGSLYGIRALGLESDKTGLLKFDTTTFATVASGSYSDMIALLTGTDGLFVKLLAKVDVVVDTTDGVVNTRITNLGNQVDDLEDRIDNAQVRLDRYEDMLIRQFTNMEVLLGKYDATKQYLDQQIKVWTQDR